MLVVLELLQIKVKKRSTDLVSEHYNDREIKFTDYSGFYTLKNPVTDNTGPAVAVLSHR